MAEVSPASDERFWGRLRDHVDDILASRKEAAAAAAAHACADPGKRRREEEDSLLLIRGIDSVATSLSRLTDTLSAAQKGVNALAACPRVREVEVGNEEEERKAKRRCSSGSPEHGGDDAPAVSQISGSTEVMKSAKLKKARNLAMSMSTRASSLAKELKHIKSELVFVQERCAMLEEENRRLRDGMEKGNPAEEDDLVRLQLEALLAEKSRLAKDNANLARENQGLRQLVEYHQLASQELSASYDHDMHGMCLDFSSPPPGRSESNDSDNDGGGNSEDGGSEISKSCGAFATPTDKLELLPSSTC